MPRLARICLNQSADELAADLDNVASETQQQRIHAHPNCKVRWIICFETSALRSLSVRGSQQRFGIGRLTPLRSPRLSRCQHWMAPYQPIAASDNDRTLSTHAQVYWHNRRNDNQGTHVPRSPGTRRAASRQSPDTVFEIVGYALKLTNECLQTKLSLHD